MQIKLIFIWMVEHQALFQKEIKVIRKWLDGITVECSTRQSAIYPVGKYYLVVYECTVMQLFYFLVWMWSPWRKEVLLLQISLELLFLLCRIQPTMSRPLQSLLAPPWQVIHSPCTENQLSTQSHRMWTGLVASTAPIWLVLHQLFSLNRR